MTRINVIPPQRLTDAHLAGEWKEITRPINKARAPRRGEEFPATYRMGKGHETFFFNKLPWLKRRVFRLYAEMHRRGWKPNLGPKLEAFTRADERLPSCYSQDWHATTADRAINYQRIFTRLWSK